MLFNITNTQTVADALKKLLSSFTLTPREKRQFKAVSETIQRFERAGWQPVAFQDALDETRGFIITYDGKLTFDFEPSDQAPDAIQALLDNYLNKINFAADEAFETQIADVFTMEEAAEYLGLAVATLKHHVYKTKKLIPTKLGRDLIFTRDDLERFKRKPRRDGRPKKNPELN